MTFRRIQNRALRQGFSLIEILVAMAVLGFLSLMVLGIIRSVSGAISASDKRQESVSQARQVLNRLGVDLASQIQREDVPYGYAPPGANVDYIGNDELGFFTEGRSYHGTRSIILAEYRINTTSYTLERAAVGFNWDDSVSWFLTEAQANTFQNNLPGISASDWQELSPLIFRFEVCFLSNEAATGNRVLDTYPPDRVEDLVAVVVTVAVLDSTSRLKISNAQLKALSDALSDPGRDQNPLKLWEDTVRSSNFAASTGVPITVAAAVRCFQQYFPFK